MHPGIQLNVSRLRSSDADGGIEACNSAMHILQADAHGYLKDVLSDAFPFPNRPIGPLCEADVVELLNHLREILLDPTSDATRRRGIVWALTKSNREEALDALLSAIDGAQGIESLYHEEYVLEALRYQIYRAANPAKYLTRLEHLHDLLARLSPGDPSAVSERAKLVNMCARRVPGWSRGSGEGAVESSGEVT
jgi:hypothetical protein